MTLLELYHQTLGKVAEFKNYALNARDIGAYEALARAAERCQENAGAVAHCLAMFGNIDLNSESLDILKGKIPDLPYAKDSPWSIAIDFISKEMSC